jgi:hypothetical protein
MIKGWKNGKHIKQWIKTLELYASPKLLLIASFPVKMAVP